MFANELRRNPGIDKKKYLKFLDVLEHIRGSKV